MPSKGRPPFWKWLLLYPEKQFTLLILLAVLLSTSSPLDPLWCGYTHGAALALALVSLFLAISAYVKGRMIDAS